MSSASHIRSQQIIIRKQHPAFGGAAYCCQITRRVKNATSYLIQNNPADSSKLMNHRDADKWLKKHNKELYTKLPAAIAQRTTQIAGQEWKSYISALKAYKRSPSKFKAKPRKPRYANEATTVHIGRNGFRVEGGVIYFAGDVLPPIKTHFSFSQTWNEKKGKTVALEVRIVPKGNCYILELIYDESRAAKAGSFCLLLDKNRKAGIDLGVNNLVAIASDRPGVRPVLINGKAIKSINAKYNKQVAKLRSQGKYNHIVAVTNKRHRRVKDLLHRASNAVVRYCIENNLGTLFIGHNPQWKQEINIGKVNNQKFVSIPHSILISQIQYKCYRAGIKAVIQEESYTSKASALDNDPIPNYKDQSDVIPIFSGKRTKRGLYKSKSGLINADVNAALNILRKATGDAFGPACKGCVFNPITVDLISSKKTVIRREKIKQLAA